MNLLPMVGKWMKEREENELFSISLDKQYLVKDTPLLFVERRQLKAL